MSVNKKILLPLILIAIFFLFYSSPFLYGQDETTISDTTLNNVLEQARAYKDQDNYKMALDEYKKIVNYSSQEVGTQGVSFVEAHRGFVLAKSKLGKINDLINYYKAKIEKDELTPGWHFGLGLSYLSELWFEIEKGDLDKFKDKVNEKSFLKMDKLVGKKFSEGEFEYELKKIGLNDSEISDVFKHSVKSGFRIEEEDFEILKEKIDEEKVKLLSPIKNKKFTRKDLTENLKDLKFTEDEIDEVFAALKSDREKVIDCFNDTLQFALVNKNNYKGEKFKENLYEEPGNIADKYGFKLTPPIHQGRINIWYIIGSLLLLAAIGAGVYFYLKKSVAEKIVLLEGDFEVYNPNGLKVYVLACSDKKLTDKNGDRITIGNKKGCDFRLKVKGDKKLFATVVAERVENRNRVFINPEKGEEIFLEVPKSQHTPDDTIKLPFKGGMLWDKDIINIHNHQVHYHNIKLSKRLYKDYPEEARGYIFADDKGEVQEVELPDIDIFKQTLTEEEEDLYNPYGKVKQALAEMKKETPHVRTSVKEEEADSKEDEEEEETGEEENTYDFEPMEEKYLADVLPPPVKEITDSDVLVYKIENPDEEDGYEYEVLDEISDQPGNKDLLVYPGEEEEEYEFEVMEPVKEEKSEDVLSYPSAEEDDDGYEFEVMAPPSSSGEKGDLLSYPVPDEEEDVLMSYGAAEDLEPEKEEISEEEGEPDVAHYPSTLTDIETAPVLEEEGEEFITGETFGAVSLLADEEEDSFFGLEEKEEEGESSWEVEGKEKSEESFFEFGGKEKESESFFEFSETEKTEERGFFEFSVDEEEEDEDDIKFSITGAMGKNSAEFTFGSAEEDLRVVKSEKKDEIFIATEEDDGGRSLDVKSNEAKKKSAVEEIPVKKIKKVKKEAIGEKAVKKIKKVKKEVAEVKAVKKIKKIKKEAAEEKAVKKIKKIKKEVAEVKAVKKIKKIKKEVAEEKPVKKIKKIKKEVAEEKPVKKIKKVKKEATGEKAVKKIKKVKKEDVKEEPVKKKLRKIKKIKKKKEGNPGK